MRYVIIGGDAAGMSAAMQLKKFDSNAEVITLEKGTIYSYGQCGLPYVISELIPSTDHLIARSPETFRQKYNIDARTNNDVHQIDPISKKTFKITYDKLLIASGASPTSPNWEGVNLSGVHMLKTIPDAHKMMDDLHEDIQNVTVIGGGYIGLEMAESFRMLGKKVRL